jgi:hypothetical protein
MASFCKSRPINISSTFPEGVVRSFGVGISNVISNLPFIGLSKFINKPVTIFCTFVNDTPVFDCIPVTETAAVSKVISLGFIKTPDVDGIEENIFVLTISISTINPIMIKTATIDTVTI